MHFCFPSTLHSARHIIGGRTHKWMHDGWSHIYQAECCVSAEYEATGENSNPEHHLVTVGRSERHFYYKRNICYEVNCKVCQHIFVIVLEFKVNYFKLWCPTSVHTHIQRKCLEATLMLRPMLKLSASLYPDISALGPPPREYFGCGPQPAIPSGKNVHLRSLRGPNYYSENDIISSKKTE